MTLVLRNCDTWLCCFGLLTVMSLGLSTTAAAQDTRSIGLPRPTGSFNVGRTTFHWTDHARPETMSGVPGAKREILVHVWYPARHSAQSPGAYISQPNRLAEALGDELLRKEFGEAFSAIKSGKLLTNSSVDAKPASTPSKFPLLVLSHGVNTMAIEYTTQAEDLASHGYIVAAIDHVYDSLASVFPDGRVVRFAADKWREGGRDYERTRVEVWAADIRFTLDQFVACRSHPSCLLAGRVDLDRIGAMGHSVGARAAASACQKDSRIRACLNEGALDRGFPFWADAKGGSMKQPFLMISRPVVFPESPTEEELAKLRMTREQFHATVAEIRRFWRSIEGGASWVQVKSATFQHNSFADSSVLAPKDAEKARAATVDLAIVCAYVREFFDRHVKLERERNLVVGTYEIKVEEFTRTQSATAQ